MDITQLRTLVHVGELGSLSRAAERLNTVQPALSRQIRLLEQELDVQLFERHGRGMTLTPMGAEIIESAARILAEVEAIRATATDERESYRGQIRIGLTPTVSEFIVPTLAGRILAEHPKVSIQFKTAFSSHLLDWLQRGDLDVVACYNPAESPALRIEPVVVETLYLVSSPGREMDLKRPVPFETLRSETFILPAKGHALREIVDDCARIAGFRVEPRIMADSMRAMLDLVKEGFGVTFLPLAPIYEDVRKGLLAAAPVVDPVPKRRVVLCYPTDRPLPASSRYVGHLFREIAAGLVRSNRWGGEML